MDFCGLLPLKGLFLQGRRVEQLSGAWFHNLPPEKMYLKEPRNNQRLPDRPNLPEATSQRLDQDTNTTSPLEASVAKANNWDPSSCTSKKPSVYPGSCQTPPPDVSLEVWVFSRGWTLWWMCWTLWWIVFCFGGFGWTLEFNSKHVQHLY